MITAIGTGTPNSFIRLLAYIGFVRIIDKTDPRTYPYLRPVGRYVRWPFSAPPFYKKEGLRGWVQRCRFNGPFYIFRNLPGVIKWEEGRILPRRWGFGIYGFEFGDRG